MSAAATRAEPVLSFAAVGLHGREWWTRVRSRALRLAVLFVAAAPTLGFAQTAPLDLVADLAAKIAEAAGSPSTIRLSIVGDAPSSAQLAALLRTRGVTVVDGAAAAPVVSVTCGRNLRESSCIAEIRRDSGAPQVVAALRRHESNARTPPAIVSLASTTLLTRRDAILDIAPAGDQWLVLGRDAVSLHAPAENPGDTGRAVASAALSHTDAWPRDIRGQLRITDNRFEAWLPGVTCRGTVKPLAVSCADERSAWPIAIENSGITGSRNAFATPSGLLFYAAASLDAGPARWLVVDRQGMLQFLDGSQAIVARGPVVDDVVRVREPCAPGVFMVAASRSSHDDHLDALQLMHVDGLTVIPVSALITTGRVTALWPSTDGKAATAIVRDDTVQGETRYEALRLSLACAR